ncbi:hypothetical protein GCM10010191_77270 [Actinomadura vinacea]|uniref:Uncharacterized protein n=1 Tax=Actinomadura vinacea TaxID=115336 RepID=A0ABP5XBD8_9ACTN
MLRVFCFDSLGVTVEDVFLIDPDPVRGGRERGVRVELRLLDPEPWRGSINASQRVVADRAVWRADFLETAADTKDRMHHHPGMIDNEPGQRVFTEDLTGDPMGWLESQLADAVPLLESAKVEDPERHRPAADALRENLAEVVTSVSAVLDRVRAGDLAKTPVRPGPR